MRGLGECGWLLAKGLSHCHRLAPPPATLIPGTCGQIMKKSLSNEVTLTPFTLCSALQRQSQIQAEHSTSHKKYYYIVSGYIGPLSCKYISLLWPHSPHNPLPSSFLCTPFIPLDDIPSTFMACVPTWLHVPIWDLGPEKWEKICGICLSATALKLA